MCRLGVTPTIQTSKEFEGITSLEEVTDGMFGAPIVKLGAYMLQEPEPETPAFRWGAYTLTEPRHKPPRVPTPEMAPMLDAMVIDVPSEEEDMVSLREEEAPIPEGLGLFGDDEDDAPLPQGLKLNLDDDMSDYGDDPETLCGPIIEPDIGRLLDKYLAYAKINCGYTSFCADCKDNSKSNFIEWIVDSGASVHFTDNKVDFSDLRFFDEKNRPQAQTTNGAAAIHSHGTVFMKTWVDNTTPKMVTISCLSPVFYMPGMGICLLSMGLLLKGNMQIKGDECTLELAK